MSEVPFTIANTSQSVRVTAAHIYSGSDHLFRYLYVPVDFLFNRPKEGSTFDVPVVTARLSMVAPAQLLSEIVLPLDISILGEERKWGRPIRFILPDNVLHFMEANRAPDVRLSLELTLQTSIKRSAETLIGKRAYFNDYLQSETVTVPFEIPQSVWIEKVLNPSGFRNLKLVEVPLTHDGLKEAYPDMIFEFQQAETYFNKQDYDKAVGHCRGTLDALSRNMKKIRDKEDSETAFEWLKNVDQETVTWIDKLNQRTSRITSIPHHPGRREGFSREEAEAIYLVTLGLLHYVGHIAP